MQPNKKPRTTTMSSSSEPTDILESLPEPILEDILSRLPIQQVIQMATLSKNWRKRWAYLTHLNFHYSGYSSMFSKRFVHFVYTTLLLRLATRIRGLYLYFNCGRWRPNIENPAIHSWIRTAIARCVTELHLHFADAVGVRRFFLPDFLFKNDVLRVLSFGWCLFKNPFLEPISWGSLKLLELTDCGNVSKVLIQRIKAGSPKIQRIDVVHSDDGTSTKRNVNYHYKKDSSQP